MATTSELVRGERKEDREGKREREREREMWHD